MDNECKFEGHCKDCPDLGRCPYDDEPQYEAEKERKAISDMTLNGFQIEEDSVDDLTLYQNGKPILNISIPEMATQWNTKLP